MLLLLNIACFHKTQQILGFPIYALRYSKPDFWNFLPKMGTHSV